MAVLSRFHIGRLVIANPDAWSVSLRALVQQAQAAGVPVVPANGPFAVDGVELSPAADGWSWLIQAGARGIVVIPPETRWQSLPADVDGAIFTAGGPTEWQGPGQGFSVIQVAANSRDGVPVRAVLQALSGVDLSDRPAWHDRASIGRRPFSPRVGVIARLVMSVESHQRAVVELSHKINSNDRFDLACEHDRVVGASPDP